jgi:hypothetical protein
VGVCRVFDDPYVVGSSEVGHHAPGHRQPGEVHRHDRLGPRRDCCRSRGDIDVEGVGADVNNDGRRAEIPDHLGCRGEGPGGHDHLVARADPQGFERQMESGRGGVDRDTVPSLDVCSVGGQRRDKLPLEGGSVGAGRQPPRAHGLDNGSDLRLTDVRHREGDEFRHLCAFPFVSSLRAS